MMKKVIQVVQNEDGEVIHEVDVTDKSDRQIDKVDSGINRNLNHEHFYTCVQEIEDRELIKSH